MNKLLKVLDKVISIILIIFVAFLATGMTLTIILRYFFGLSFSTLEELLTMTFIFITLFGSAIAIREKQHISIAFLADKIVGDSKTKKTISVILIDASIILISIVMFKYSCSWIKQVGHLVSPNSHLPMAVYYVFMPISFVLTIFYAAVDILSCFVKIEPAKTGYSNDEELPKEEN